MITAGVPTSIQDLRARVARLFEGRAGTATRAGAEIELFGVHLASLTPAPRADVEPALPPAPLLAGLAIPSFEPGGQLELSVLPAVGVDALLRRCRDALDAVEAATARRGLATVACGTDPLAGRQSWDLQIEGTRYSVMQAHFDRVGGRGRRMMRQTAALQICVEVPGGPAGRDAWDALNLAAPALAAAFANGPVLEGAVHPFAAHRLAVWLETDPSRTGFDGAQLDASGEDAVDAYTEFALDALVMPLPRGRGAGGGDGDGELRTLREWLRLQEARPDGDDLDHHLTTLFPPVRPRGEYLEVRCIDALPWQWAEVAVHTVVLAAQDPGVRAAALECCGPHRRDVAGLWGRAATAGIRDPLLAGQAGALLEAAERALRRAGRVDAARRVGDYRARFLAVRRCPGDELAELLSRFPEALTTWR